MDVDFEGMNHFSLSAEGIYRIGHDNIRGLEWMAFYIGHCENITYFDFVASVLSCPNEISEW